MQRRGSATCSSTLLAVALAVVLVAPALAQQPPGDVSAQVPTPARPSNAAPSPAVVLGPGQAGLKGVVGHWWYVQRYGDKLLDEYARLGVTNVRLGVDWRDIEGIEGHRSFERLDPIMDAFADRGIEVVPVVATVPVWASLNPAECANNTRQCSMNVTKLGVFRSTMVALVARYPEARRWEFWNEPEMWAGLRRPSDYEPWYRAFRDAAMAANPRAVVAVGTLSGWNFVSGLSRDLPIDAVTLHPYAGDDWGMDTHAIQRLHDGLVSRGWDVPIWITEYGWAQWMDPVRRAATLSRMFRWMQTQPYIQLADYHMLHDTEEADECCWGLVGPPPNFTPRRPAYEAFQSVVVESWTATPLAHAARAPAAPGAALAAPLGVAVRHGAPGPLVLDEPGSPTQDELNRPLTAGTTPREDVTMYAVSRGDSLRTIAERVYGDQDAWSVIYLINRDTIGADPDALVVGDLLQIPAR
jgi:hypothetical protein